MARLHDQAIAGVWDDFGGCFGMPRFTISARGKPNNIGVLGMLQQSFSAIPLQQIDSLFGFVEYTPLYGGRVFVSEELTPSDVTDLYSVGIGLRLPLTNHVASSQEYEDSYEFLSKYHVTNNAVIVTNDVLARWIRRDFPKFRIEASVIKNLRSIKRVEQAFDLYDTVVLPMELNEQPDLLAKLPNEDRITLFANAGCALTCPSRICYSSISKMNKRAGGEFSCSQPLKARDLRGMIDFDLEKLQHLGFSRFKVLRSRRSGMTGF